MKLLTRILFLYFFLNTENGYAQEKWLEAFIVNLKGDTIQGQLKTYWTKTPQVIQFRTSETTDKEYTTEDILSFGYADKSYIYRTATVEIEDRKTSNMFENPKNGKIPFVQKKVFVLLKLEGAINFYIYYNTEQGRDYYIVQEQQKTPVTLSYTKYYDRDGLGTTKIKEQTLYKKQLLELMPDYPDANPYQFIQKIKYKESVLLKLLKTYLENKRKYQREYKKLANPVYVGCIIGMAYNKVRFSGLSSTEVQDATLDYEFSPTLGLAFENFINPKRKTWAIYFESAISQYKTNHTMLSPSDLATNPVNGAGKWEYNIKLAYLKVGTMMRYYFPKKAIKPFLGAGFSYGLGGGTIDASILRASAISQPQLSKIKVTNRYGFMVGAGVLYKNFSLEARFEQYKVTTEKLLLEGSMPALAIQGSFFFERR